MTELRDSDRAEPAQPPERVQLPVERRAAELASRRSVTILDAFSRSDFTRRPGDRLGRVQVQPDDARPIR